MSDEDQSAVTPPLDDEQLRIKLLYLANKQAQKELEDGTASSQIVTHFLKLDTQRNEIELRKLDMEARLLESRIENEELVRQREIAMEEVLEALTSYKFPIHNIPTDQYNGRD